MDDNDALCTPEILRWLDALEERLLRILVMMLKGETPSRSVVLPAWFARKHHRYAWQLVRKVRADSLPMGWTLSLRFARGDNELLAPRDKVAPGMHRFTITRPPA